MADRPQPDPERRLPTDPFSVFRRNWTDNPGAAKARGTIDLQDDYGNLETWVLETYRADGREVVFLQRVDQAGAVRLVLPPKVTEALRRQRDSVDGQVRRKAAEAGLQTKRAKGQRVGNPEALKAARKARKS